MSKKCAKCEKTVYPTEELKCLDKIWHKGCFKCQVCNMTLNMKNYKGYDKMPYCNAHYPQTKHTQVADTPEMRRIADNTVIQSNIKYHQEFEKQKGKKISVDDDPEMARVKQHMKTVSNVAYHGTLEQKQHMEENRPSQEGDAQQFRRRNPGKISEYDPPVQSGGTPYSQRTSQTNVVYDSEIGKVESASSGRKVGSIADYDPMNDRYGSIAGQAPSYKAPPQQYQPPPQQYQPPPQQYQPPPQQQYQPPPQQQYQPPPPQAPVDRQSKGMVCKAMYDYTAADDDEVSFQDGDEIIFCQPVDAGWMMGTVQRTGQRGMLPSNYVEQIK